MLKEFVGAGSGPLVAGFTVVVQSLVPAHRNGVASSTLTVIRQVGAVVGLALAGTTFSSIYQNRLPESLAAHGVPPAVIEALTRLSGVLQGVGNGSGILAHVLPAPQRHILPAILAGANEDFASAVGDTFWITLIAGGAAFLITLALRDRELERSAPPYRRAR